jgi:hypothetical protein
MHDANDVLLLEVGYYVDKEKLGQDKAENVYSPS